MVQRLGEESLKPSGAFGPDVLYSGSMDLIRQTDDGRFTLRSSAQSTANGEFWANFVVTENAEGVELELHRSQADAYATGELASEAGMLAAQAWLQERFPQA